MDYKNCIIPCKENEKMKFILNKRGAPHGTPLSYLTEILV